ncbi:hypothetical protein GRJ2_000194200 [Grus japonensis]|uniref:ribonuclease H n=1 Tax=Grus japonensis TaxID=30415 RepID=A0ABC9VVP3_GRUJA
MPSSYKGAEPICISGVMGGFQQVAVLEAKVSLTGNEWQKHPIVTGPEALCILGIDYLWRGYFKDPKGYWWGFGIAALEMEEIKQLSTVPGLSEDPSVMGLLRGKEQQVPVTTTAMHWGQYCTNQDSLIRNHKLICQLESQGVISRTRLPFDSPIWPVRKYNGEWRPTVDYCGLNEVTPPMSAAVPDTLELQYKLESKIDKWYATVDVVNAFFSVPLTAECRPQFAFTWRGVQYTWNQLPQGWEHSPTICHGLIQTALEQSEAPERLQYIDDIIVWGNTAEEVSEKGKKIVQILLKAGFAIKQIREEEEEERFDQEASPSAKKWEEGVREIRQEAETTWSLTSSELQDMRKDYSRQPDYVKRGYFKDPKGYQWAFGVAIVNTEKIKQLSTLPGLLEDPFVVGLLRVEEQQVPIATRTVHRQQYCTNRDSLAPIHELIHQLESQGVISKTHSPFNSPIWPVQKSDGGWRLTVGYRGLNKVMPPLSAVVPDMLEFQYELESKAAKWYATIDIANAFSQSL